MEHTPADLRDFLIKHYSSEELDALCYTHFPDALQHIPPASSATSLMARAQALVEYHKNRESLNQLIRAIEQGRPNLLRDFVPGKAQPSASLSQLRPPRDFVGRGEQIAQLIEQLRSSPAHAAAISGLEGMGGIGKTALATMVGWQLREDYPDAQLLVPLGANTEAPMTPETALAWVIHAFYPDLRLPDDLPSLQAEYWRVLSDKRVFLILDDADDDADVDPLLPPPGCAAIVTSRQRMEALPQLMLPLMPRAEGIALLQKICPRLSASEADAIAQACEDLPLALSVAGGVLKAERTLRVADYLQDLRQLGLQKLASERRHLSVHAVFESSYRKLNEAQQAAFRALAFMQADFDEYAAIAVMVGWVDGDERANAGRGLRELESRNLLLFNLETRRYRYHDLILVFAEGKLRAAPEQTDTVQQRYIDYFEAAMRELGRQQVQHIDWTTRQFDLDRAHLTRTFDLLHSTQQRYRLVRFGLQSINTMLIRLSMPDIVQWMMRVQTNAREIGDKQREGKALGNIGLAQLQMGNLQEAIQYSQQWLSIAREIGDKQSEGKALGGIGLAQLQMGNLQEAIQYSQQQLSIAREIGDKQSEGMALGGIGQAYRIMEDWDKAAEYYEYAIAMLDEISDQYSLSIARWGLSFVYESQNNIEHALKLVNECLTYEQNAGLDSTDAEAINRIATLQAKLRGETPG